MPGDFLGLVVAPLCQPGRMQGQGDDPVRRGRQPGQLPAPVFGQGEAGVVFQVADQVVQGKGVAVQGVYLIEVGRPGQAGAAAFPVGGGFQAKGAVPGRQGRQVC